MNNPNNTTDSSILDLDFVQDSSLLTEDGSIDHDLALWIDSIECVNTNEG